MKPGKKIQKKLERRQRGHQQIISNMRNLKANPEAYRVPGSRNPKRG